MRNSRFRLFREFIAIENFDEGRTSGLFFMDGRMSNMNLECAVCGHKLVYKNFKKKYSEKEIEEALESGEPHFCFPCSEHYNRHALMDKAEKRRRAWYKKAIKEKHDKAIRTE